MASTKDFPPTPLICIKPVFNIPGVKHIYLVISYGLKVNFVTEIYILLGLLLSPESL